ncbi:hypothetical protein L1987_08817 [Smallanthus sonchifolius]|uniref:Uncharacterized protein n=1 Tax=Smallanthus sonchifolius TaxID=185202 RepID=A0ACB9JM72_9ASTR|nr:hypothetical protein L1987_08817 [Smallanthus sonchifolius]
MKAHYSLKLNQVIINCFYDSIRIFAGVLALLCSWVGLWLAHHSARRYDLLSRPHFLWHNLMGRFPNLSLTPVLRRASPMKLTLLLRSGAGLGNQEGEGVGGRTSLLLVSSPCMTQYGTVSPESVSEFAPSASPPGSSSDSSSGFDSDTFSSSS